MQNEFNRGLESFEKELGEKLRDLPEVRPDPEFSQRLWNKMASSKSNSVARGKQTVGMAKLFRLPRMGMVAAALLLVLAGGWIGGILTQQDQMAGIGTLLVPCAQAAPGQTANLSFRLGLQNALNKLQFKLEVNFPKLPSQLQAERLIRPDWTVADVETLAKRIGINGTTTAGSASSQVYVADPSADLTYSLDSGTFYYKNKGEGSDEPATLGPEQAQAAALAWIEKAGLLLDENYLVETREDGLCYWVTIRQELGPDNRPIVSYRPSYRILVTPGENIAAADGGWYESEASMLLPVTSFREAFAALKRGEGEFIAQGFSSYSAGDAVVTGVKLGYQLAYTLDYTPYLVPVAVFEGDITPEGRDTVPFMAYVSLVKRTDKHNAGNFIMATNLPSVPQQLPVLTERPLVVSESELPTLLSFFGMADAKLDEYSKYSIDGAELGATSWDGGWLWRGVWKSQSPVTGPISTEQAKAIARELAEALPSLPGGLSEPDVLGFDDDYYWVQFNLLYADLMVDSLGAPNASRLSVQVESKTGHVTTVNCAKPMQISPSRQTVITPEQAWKKLLSNEAIVYVDYVGEALPASGFMVDESKVLEAKLVYMPRDRNFSRNEFYDLKYVFKGTALIGDRETGFTAVVDANK